MSIRVHSRPPFALARSEEHTSELQSLTNLVCRLLLEKKKRSASHLRIHLFPKIGILMASISLGFIWDINVPAGIIIAFSTSNVLTHFTYSIYFNYSIF